MPVSALGAKKRERSKKNLKELQQHKRRKCLTATEFIYFFTFYALVAEKEVDLIYSKLRLCRPCNARNKKKFVTWQFHARTMNYCLQYNCAITRRFFREVNSLIQWQEDIGAIIQFILFFCSFFICFCRCWLFSHLVVINCEIKWHDDQTLLGCRTNIVLENISKFLLPT